MIPIRELHLSSRTEHTLISLGFHSAEQLTKHRAAELLLMRHIGRAAVESISAALAARGLALLPDRRRPPWKTT